MKASLTSTFYLFAICFVWLACESKPKKIDTSNNITVKVQKPVIIYGSVACDHCNEFKKQMDNAKFTYTFKDADANEEVYQELVFKIQNAGKGGYVSYPVLDIDGEIYIKPDFNTIKKILSD